MEGIELSRRSGVEKKERLQPQDDGQSLVWADDTLNDKEKEKLLQKWANLDVTALAVSTAQGLVMQRPVLVSFWVFGLLIAAFAGGLSVDATSKEAYSHMRQEAELIDSREFRQQALVELQRAEENYELTRGWFGACDGNCTQAFDKVQMARQEVARVQAHRDTMLSEGRREVGIWSSFGVQDVRACFWKAWQAGKDFAARCTFWNVMFAGGGGRNDSLIAFVIQIVLQYVVNLTLGMIGAFFAFMYNVYCLIVSYGSSVLAGSAFFLLAAVAGMSLLATYLLSVFAVVAGGGVMLMQRAANQAALEMPRARQKELGNKPPEQSRRCPV